MVFNFRLNYNELMKKILILLLLSLGLIGTTSAGEVETNILKLKALNACVSCNLKRANLTGANLSGANLKNADLRKANLSGANLKNADLSEAFLSGTDLSEAFLNGADLSKAFLFEADLSETYLTDANFTGATFCNTEAPWGIENSGC